MKPATKDATALLSGGLLGLVSLGLPWTDDLSLVQLLAVNEVRTTFPAVPLEFALADSQLAAVYVTFAASVLASSFAVAIAGLQHDGARPEFRRVRVLAIALYVSAALSATHFPTLPPEPAGSSYGFFVFSVPPLLFALAEHHYEDASVVHDVRNLLGRHRPGFDDR